LDHDFPIKELGRFTPYGVYDVMKNAGFVNVGLSNDAAEFAVQSICKWWREVGQVVYPAAKSIYVTVDSGGGDGVGVRLWKVVLQGLVDELGLVLRVSHFPVGTSKWNKVEHRLFCFIGRNWCGRPLVSLVVIVDLIGVATTVVGLAVKCVVDRGECRKGFKVFDEELAKVNLFKEVFHGEWNYSILPNNLSAQK
jgi:hypothetical protein